MRDPDRPRTRMWPWVAVCVVVAAVVATLVVPKALAGHRKVLVIGDSLSAQSTPAFDADLQAKGFTPEVHALSGTGLLDTQTNWAAQAAELVKSFDPDVVSVEFIGNYGLFGERPGVAPHSPQFYAAWAQAAQQLENVLTSRGAQVYWVIGPPVAQAQGEQELVQLDHIYESLHAPDTPSGRPLTIDEVTPFSAPGGGYTGSVPDPSGAPVPVRAPDGTHFTQAGFERFAAVVTQTIANGPTRSTFP